MRKSIQLPRDDVALSSRDLVAIFRAKDRASADAQRQLPAKDDTNEPPAIQEIRDAVGARIDSRHRTVQERLRALEDAVVALPDAETGGLKKLAAEIETEVVDAFSDLEPETRRRIGEERSFKSTLLAFRDKRKLYRDHLGADAKLAYFAPVAVSTLAEAVGQSWLYTEATSSGVLGAVALAVAVSGTNAAIGIVSGVLPSRALNEQTLWARSLGAIGVATTAGLLLTLNITAAKFRDVLAAGSDIESALQVAKLFNAEWSLTLPGAAVFGFGIANAAYAWLRGYRSCDPIIGHERLARAHQDKLDAVNDLEAVVDGRLSEILSRTVSYGRDRPRARVAELQNLRRELTALGNLTRRNKALEDSDLKALALGIDAYRRTNLYVRADKVVPACLTGDIDVEQHRQSDIPLDGLAERIEVAMAAEAPRSSSWINQVDKLAEIVSTAKENRTQLLQAIERHDPKSGQAPELKTLCASLRAVVADSPTSNDSDANHKDDGGEPWQSETYTKAVA